MKDPNKISKKGARTVLLKRKTPGRQKRLEDCRVKGDWVVEDDLKFSVPAENFLIIPRVVSSLPMPTPGFFSGSDLPIVENWEFRRVKGLISKYMWVRQ